MKLAYALVIAIAAIFIILYTIEIRRDWNYLEGVWLADGDEFCDNAGIDSFMLYIGAPEDNTTRAGYLLITPSIAAHEVSLRILGPSLSKKGGYKARLGFDDNENAPLPENVTLHVSREHGLMHIIGDGKICARLYKRHDLTDN